MQNEIGSNDTRRLISKGYELLLFKPIATEKLAALESLYTNAYNRFKNDPANTCEIIGENNKHNNPETAALIIVANAMLNLDEVVTRE